ncbi:MAG: serine/threonine protein kinase [Candidatus Obscuribacterales bacterium]|nr:serine/threonine protein kinase [Candidatus Obscuribacterales bacterium]
MSEELISLSQNDPELFPARYENRGLLHEGGMGRVYRVFEKQLQREMAIKMLHFSQSSDKSTEERFMREAKILASLEHPNIVKLMNWGSNASGEIYLVMELLEGKTLAEELKEKPLGPGSFFEVFLQVLKGLSYAHQKGVIHRDLKPENLILSRKETELKVKIIDFGISQTESAEFSKTETLTKTGAAIGSPVYMSPEQCKGEELKASSDIYSLACVMYESLSGAPPHGGESSMEIQYKHCNLQAPSLDKLASSNTEKRLAKVLDECLSIDPSKRPQSAEELFEILKQISGESTQTGNFFRTRAEGKILKLHHPLLFGALLLAITITSTVFLISNKIRSPKLSSPVALNKEADKSLERLQKDRERFRKRYLSAPSGDEKYESAQQYLDGIFEYSEGLRSMGRSSEAKQALEEALSLCKVLDLKSEQCQAKTLYNIASCQLDEKDYKGAQKSLDKARACKFGSDLTSGDICRAQIGLDINTHDFKDASKNLEKIWGFEKANEEMHRSDLSVEMMGRFQKKNAAHKLIKNFGFMKNCKHFIAELREQKLESLNEINGAVEFLNLITCICLDYQSAVCEQSLAAAEYLLKAIPESDKETEKLKERTNELRSIQRRYKQEKRFFILPADSDS